MKRVGVIAHSNDEVALGIKRQRTAHVTALFALRGDVDDRLLTGHIELVALERKPAHANDALLLAVGVLGGLGQRPVQVDPFVLREIGIERDAKHAVLQSGEGRHLGNLNARLARRHHPHDAVALRVKHRAVRPHHQLHWILQAVDELVVLLDIALEDDLAEIPSLLRAAGFGLRDEVPGQQQAGGKASDWFTHNKTIRRPPRSAQLLPRWFPLPPRAPRRSFYP